MDAKLHFVHFWRVVVSLKFNLSSPRFLKIKNINWYDLRKLFSFIPEQHGFSPIILKDIFPVFFGIFLRVTYPKLQLRTENGVIQVFLSQKCLILTVLSRYLWPITSPYGKLQAITKTHIWYKSHEDPPMETWWKAAH